MRIAQVNDIAAVASTLADAQRALGHEVDLLGAKRPIVNRNRALRVLTVPLRMLATVAVALPIRRGRYDVVHFHYAWKGIAAVLARRRYVLHCHGTDVREIRGGLRGWLNAVAERHAALVYYATPDLAPWVQPNRPDAIFLPNPIDTSSFTAKPPAARTIGGGAGGEARETLAPDRHDLLADALEPGPGARDVLVGVRLDSVKGAEAVIETVRAIRRLRPATTFTIVRQGALVHDAMAAAGQTVELVERSDRAALPALFRRHRIALGQMLVGAIGNYELEAMASGVPVAMRFAYPDAYDVPPPIVDGATAEELAHLVCAALQDEGGRREIAEAARVWVVAHHDALSVARRVLADYERICN